MPNTAENQDIAFQPNSKGYSYSNSEMSEETNKKKKGIFFALVYEILGLTILFFVFWGVLNYFSIISLNSINPILFGWLPHLNQTTGIKLANQTPVTNNQSPAPANFAKLQNQASNTQMQKYISYATGFSEPAKDPNSNNYVSNGVFSGYDNQTVQVVTKDGTLNLSFDTNTLFQNYPASAHQPNTNGLVGPTSYTSAQDFFKNVSFGSVVLIFYSKSNLKAAQVNYIESVKPVL